MRWKRRRRQQSPKVSRAPATFLLCKSISQCDTRTECVCLWVFVVLQCSLAWRHLTTLQIHELQPQRASFDSLAGEATMKNYSRFSLDDMWHQKPHRARKIMKIAQQKPRQELFRVLHRRAAQSWRAKAIVVVESSLFSLRACLKPQTSTTKLHNNKKKLTIFYDRTMARFAKRKRENCATMIWVRECPRMKKRLRLEIITYNVSNSNLRPALCECVARRRT